MDESLIKESCYKCGGVLEFTGKFIGFNSSKIEWNYVCRNCLKFKKVITNREYKVLEETWLNQRGIIKNAVQRSR